MAIVTKRSSMTFFSDPLSHYSHRVRIVLAEKGVAVDIINVNPDDLPQELADYNPYNTLPTLVDRELSLYQPNIIMEYLDERFPHPPLLPVYPVERAQSRLLMYRVDRDWSPLVDRIIAQPDGADADAARKELAESLTSISPIFEDKEFFMREEFSLIDCVVAPILWRLDYLGVKLPEKPTRPLRRYMDRLFKRESFKASLSELEQEMRA
ncbi:glutathione S-transferase N-terminal domain-containing protein [Hahella sp. SMD15-11]|uniref:Glutathione S-transferase N-terminal domain-containing protein n=1 Tax=Thermohahella caldifontis TaxID=3142973 RepID=A0AB39UX67_9GAMM